MGQNPAFLTGVQMRLRQLAGGQVMPTLLARNKASGLRELTKFHLGGWCLCTVAQPHTRKWAAY